MRQVVALSLVVSVLATGPALALQDRYGPPRNESAQGISAGAAAAPSVYLGWHGKAAAAEAAGSADRRPAPLTPLAQRLSGQAMAAPVRALPTPPDRPQAFNPSMTVPAQVRAAPVAQPMAAPQATNMAPTATERPRFYSVVREFGAQPDPIPVARPAAGQSLTLAEAPASPQLARTAAPMDDARPDPDDGSTQGTRAGASTSGNTGAATTAAATNTNRVARSGF